MDLKDIKAIIDLMRKNDLSVFELEKDGFKLKLVKGDNGRPIITTPLALAPMATGAGAAASTGQQSRAVASLSRRLTRRADFSVPPRRLSPAYLEEVRTHGLGECLCPEVFWTGHRMQARNTTQCPRMPDIVAGLKAPVAHACIPLKFEGATKGVLNVAARPGELFSEEELRFPRDPRPSDRARGRAGPAPPPDRSLGAGRRG